jgi:hypothetical protein
MIYHLYQSVVEFSPLDFFSYSLHIGIVFM